MFGNYYQVSFFSAMFNFREINVALEDLCQYQQLSPTFDILHHKNIILDFQRYSNKSLFNKILYKSTKTILHRNGRILEILIYIKLVSTLYR